jgi:hypothetical protein
VAVFGLDIVNYQRFETVGQKGFVFSNLRQHTESDYTETQLKLCVCELAFLLGGWNLILGGDFHHSVLAWAFLTA